jgi:N-methylhydantoinase A
VPGRQLELPVLELTAGAPEPAGRRDAWFDGGWVDTPVHELDALRPGHRVSGPTIVQAAYTTAVIPPGRVFHIEEHGLGILDREN